MGLEKAIGNHTGDFCPMPAGSVGPGNAGSLKRIVCSFCRLGPLDGRALRRAGPGWYVCKGGHERKHRKEMKMRNLILAGAALALAGPLPGCYSPQQAAALTCVLASDGATVAAIYKPGVAPKATASAQVACDAGARVGAILAAPTAKP